MCAGAKATIAAFAIGFITASSNSNIQAALVTKIKFFNTVEDLICAQSFGAATRQNFILKVFKISIIIFNNSAALLLPINKKTNEELSVNAIINTSWTETLSASNSIGSTAAYGEVMPIVTNVKNSAENR